MNSVEKILSLILSVVVINVLVFCVVWTVRNWDNVYSSLDGTSFYTHKDIEDAYQSGYNQASKNEVDFNKALADLREELITTQNQNADLVKENTTYKNFIERYGRDGVSVVTFESENVLYDLVPVDNNTTLQNVIASIHTPVRDGYNFMGWSLDGETVVDPLVYKVIENIVLRAVYEIKVYTVSFVYENHTLKEVEVKHGSLIPATTLEQSKQLAIDYHKSIHPNDDMSKLRFEFNQQNYVDYRNEVINQSPDYSTYLIKSDIVIDFDVYISGDVDSEDVSVFDDDLLGLL